jgi:uncharacterized protein YndB with AHSA1/START domain
MSGEFEIRREVEVPANPEDVWEAVATAAGNAAWLFPGGEVDGEARRGAKTADGSTITTWDPPAVFAVRSEGDGWFNAVEFQLEGRDGGTTLVRYAHAGIFVDDWDTQYDAVNQHTDFYLHTLGQYLEHFAPQTASYVGGGPGGLMGPEASMTSDAFEKLKGELGASATGDRVSLPNGGGDGVVDYATDKFLGVRTGDALYRFFGRNAFGGPVGMSIHHFGDVDVDAASRDWSEWLEGVYR